MSTKSNLLKLFLFPQGSSVPFIKLVHSINYLLFFLLGIIIFLITYKPVGVAVSPGLDPSWIFTLNYSFAQHWIIGKQILFTYGPLGFLAVPQAIAHNLLIATIFWNLINLILVFYLLKLISIANTEQSAFYKFFIFALVVIFLSITGSMWTCLLNLFFLTYISIIFSTAATQNHIKQQIHLGVALGIASIAFLIKPLYGIACLISTYVYIFSFSMIRKDYKILLSSIIFSFVSYFIIWFFIYHSFSGTVNYLIATWQFMKGYPTAMSISPANNWHNLARGVFFFLLPGLIFLKRPIFSQNGLIVFLSLLIPSILFLKYGIVREDGHIDILELIIFYYFLLLLILVNSKRYFLMLSGAMIASLFFINLALKSVDQNFSFYFNLHGWQTFYSTVIHYPSYENALKAEAKQNIISSQLPTNILNKVGSKPVDIYPYDSTIAFFNNLNWQPRPVFQSYSAYTPYLDKMNENFLAKRNIDYIIWHNPSVLSSIDNRSLLNDEPQALFQILNWYKPVLTSANVILLEKQEAPQLSFPHLISKTDSTWETWISIPKNHYDIIQAQVDIQRSLLGRLKIFLYKEEPVTVEYKTVNNEIISRRIIVDNARNGIWINPFLNTLLVDTASQKLTLREILSSPLQQQILAIRFKSAKNDFFEKNIIINWIGINTKPADSLS